MPGFLQGNEIWILILLVILLILGPTKLPELAKGIGQAMREFKKATSDLTEEEKRSVRTMASTQSYQTSQRNEIDPEMIRKLAEKLGVSSSDRSEEELIKEIVAKAKEKGII